MKIDNNRNLSTFRAARGNILAIGDVHGNTMTLPRVLKTIENNAKDIFYKSGEVSTANFFTIVGDWFINLSKKGFITHPEITNGDLQNIALLKLIDNIENIVKNTRTTSAKNQNGHSELKVLFTLGNHDLDGGADKILNIMKKNPMTTLVTNINFNKSPKINSIMTNNDKVVTSYICEIQDDKKENLKHKILFLGTTIPSMDFYNPGICEGLEFLDNSNQKDTSLTKENLNGTIEAVKNEVTKFKMENPKGAIVLMSHMGERISEIIRKSVPEINLILNGHDHKNTQSTIGHTSINSLGKDNEMLKAINFEFDDDGNFIKSTMTPYFTETTIPDGLEKHPFQLFLNDYLKKDLEPLIKVDELKIEIPENLSEPDENLLLSEELQRLGIRNKKIAEAVSNNDELKSLLLDNAYKKFNEARKVPHGINKLSYGNEIRYRNSYLMNYLTSALKRVIRDTIDEDVFTVAIPSSIVRGGIKDGANNLQIMKVFDGVSEDLSNVKIGTLKGNELVGLIVENVLDNIKSPTRNTIIHWSDVQINKSMIEDIKNGVSTSDYSETVRVRNKDTQQFEPIDLTEDYKIAICEKYLLKDSIEWPPKIRDKFIDLNKTYDELFRTYLEQINYDIKITPKTKEKRIFENSIM